MMVLSGVPLFPHALLPLHVFEPRYRVMLAHALAGERMFAVATLRPGVAEARRPADIFPVAGVGLVRACVGNPDGTSNLILQGVARVRFTEFLQEKPFRIARIESLSAGPDEGGSGGSNAATVETEALGEKVMELCGRFQEERGVDLPPPLQTHALHLADPDLLVDLVGANPHYLPDPLARQKVLEATPAPARLRLLIALLTTELDEDEG